MPFLFKLLAALVIFSLVSISGQALAQVTIFPQTQFSGEGFVIGSKESQVSVRFLGSNSVLPEKTDDTVLYRNVWQGVDAVYDIEGEMIQKSTYYVDLNQEGVSPNSIKLRYSSPVKVDAQGALHVGSLSESAPVAWQIVDGIKKDVPVSFSVIDPFTVGFEVLNYDHKGILVIDPVYTWNAFLGYDGTDEATTVVVDESGNVYVTGSSSTTWGEPVTAHTGNQDGFLAKFNSTGTLVWSTFFGGSGSEVPTGIGVDSLGDIYIAGHAASGTWGSPVRAYSGSTDVFVIKVSSSTGALMWNTFLGASSVDVSAGLAVESDNDIYVTGNSNATWGTPVRSYTSSADTFVAKLNPTTGALVWNTFLGGSLSDQSKGIDVDASGVTYVIGQSPGTWGSPVNAYTGPVGTDVFVAKVNSNGSLAWNTFMGVAGSDNGLGVGVGESGDIYVSGDSPVTWGSPIRSFTGLVSDVFVAKLNSSGARQWNTFLGGEDTDTRGGLVVGPSDVLYVAGTSRLTWETPVRAHQNEEGGLDAFLARLNSDGSLVWNTFLGGTGNDSVTDYGNSLALGADGNIFVVGYSGASWGTPFTVFSETSTFDAFVAKVNSSGAVPTVATQSTITSSAGTGGTISPNGATLVDSGNSLAFTITAASGYEIEDVLVDSVSVGAVSTYEFTNVDENHTISVTFSAVPTPEPEPTPAPTPVPSYPAANGPIFGMKIGFNLADYLGRQQSAVAPTITPSVSTKEPSFVPTNTVTIYSRNLGIGSTGEDVRNLQKFLNSFGFAIALSGPGSPGNETTYYGQRTAAAVKRLQEANREVVLTPYGLVSGTGYFGPATRKYLEGLKF